MRKTLWLLVATLLLGSTQVLQLATTSATPSSSTEGSPVEAPSAGIGREQTGLLWGKPTLIYNLWGIKCWKVHIARNVFRGGYMVAAPGFDVTQWCGAGGKVLSGTTWKCSTVKLSTSYAWHEYFPCAPSFSPHSKPSRDIGVDYDFLNTVGYIKDVDLQMTVTHDGWVAYIWTVEW